MHTKTFNSKLANYSNLLHNEIYRFRNMLNSILKTERIYFSDITLMIFDECHNCNEAHPYKSLANFSLLRSIFVLFSFDGNASGQPNLS